MRAFKPVIINADDYGMDEGVDEAILDLVEKGVVGAVSCMVLSPQWEASATKLMGRAVDRGLHLDLTSPFTENTNSSWSLPQLIAQAHLGLLSRHAVREAVQRQLDAYESSFHIPPDFVDGHQHVHHLPVIFEVLLDELHKRYEESAKKVFIRCCHSQKWNGVKAVIVRLTQARNFKKIVREHGHILNSDFAGFYNFNPSADLAALWNQWLSRRQGDLPLIMCHPATKRAQNKDDTVRASRLAEYAFLSSAKFQELCQRHAAKPTRWTFQMK